MSWNVHLWYYFSSISKAVTNNIGQIIDEYPRSWISVIAACAFLSCFITNIIIYWLFIQQTRKNSLFGVIYTCRLINLSHESIVLEKNNLVIQYVSHNSSATDALGWTRTWIQRCYGSPHDLQAEIVVGKLLMSDDWGCSLWVAQSWFWSS